MAIERKKRLDDGSLGEVQKIGNGATTSEQVATLGMQLAQEKFASIQKDALINGLGSQVAQMKIELMLLKGGAQ